MSDTEHQLAMQEAERNAAVETYIKARPQLDTGHNRKIFESGFDRGYEAAKARIAELEADNKAAWETNRSIDRARGEEMKKRDTAELRAKELEAQVKREPVIGQVYKSQDKHGFWKISLKTKDGFDFVIQSRLLVESDADATIESCRVEQPKQEVDHGHI